MSNWSNTSKRRVLITGAGSGIGAATAALLAPAYDLVLVGRRADRLEEIATTAREVGAEVRVCVFDVAHGDAFALLDEVGAVSDIVLSAGLNTPRRTWADQLPDEFHGIIATNLLGVADVIAAALPGLRASSGVAVVVSSRSAWVTSPQAGVAYRASKSALRSITDSLNEEEGRHGVRACHLCPGNVASEFLDKRPSPPTDADIAEMLSPTDVARAVKFVLDSPPHVRIDELAISPSIQ